MAARMREPSYGVKGAPASAPFMQAPNAMLRDRRLSSDARLLLAYIASFEQGWRFFVATVQADLGWGRDRLRKVMTECERSGALRMDRERRADGTLGGLVLVVSWRPWATQIAAEVMRTSD